MGRPPLRGTMLGTGRPIAESYRLERLPAGSPAVDHPPSPASLACNILAPIPVMTIALVGIFIGTADRKEPWDSGRAFLLG